MEEQKVKPKIIQIISAERGWHLRMPFRNGDGTQVIGKNGAPFYRSEEVACWALLDDGECTPMISTEGSNLYSPYLESNGAGYEGELLSPLVSWIYKTTSGDKPEEMDWELAGFASDTESERAIWRRPY